MSTQATPTCPGCLRRVEPSAPLCAHKGEQPLHYVTAEHTAERGVLATAALRRRLVLAPTPAPTAQLRNIGRKP